MNLKRWFQEHSLKLLAIRDTPEAIAGGITIGIFFGFTPLMGFKTLLSILFAWLTRSNILAAVLAVSSHDILFLLMPFIYQFEFELGSWVLSHPHQFPPSHIFQHFRDQIHPHKHSWEQWAQVFIFGVGRPMLVGSLVFSTPVSLASYFVSKVIVARHQAKKHPHPNSLAQQQTNPS